MVFALITCHQVTKPYTVNSLLFLFAPTVTNIFGISTTALYKPIARHTVLSVTLLYFYVCQTTYTLYFRLIAEYTVNLIT